MLTEMFDYFRACPVHISLKLFRLYPAKTRKELIHSLLSMPLVTEFAALLVGGSIPSTRNSFLGNLNKILEFAEKQIALHY